MGLLPAALISLDERAAGSLVASGAHRGLCRKRGPHGLARGLPSRTSCEKEERVIQQKNTIGCVLINN